MQASESHHGVSDLGLPQELVEAHPGTIGLLLADELDVERRSYLGYSPTLVRMTQPHPLADRQWRRSHPSRD